MFLSEACPSTNSATCRADRRALFPLVWWAGIRPCPLLPDVRLLFCLVASCSPARGALALPSLPGRRGSADLLRIVGWSLWSSFVRNRDQRRRRRVASAASGRDEVPWPALASGCPRGPWPRSRPRAESCRVDRRRMRWGAPLHGVTWPCLSRLPREGWRVVASGQHVVASGCRWRRAGGRCAGDGTR